MEGNKKGRGVGWGRGGRVGGIKRGKWMNNKGVVSFFFSNSNV